MVQPATIAAAGGLRGMAKGRKLKVYKMAVGFHDAFVAAPTQKAAIEAWGSDKDVFSRGRAELVEDPALTKEPLARPGEIVKRLRGTAEEQIAALGDADRPAPAKAAAPKPKPAKPKPRPSRKALDRAEEALEALQARHSSDREALARREAELAHDRKAMEQAQRAERERLEMRRDKAEAAYDAAIRKWRG